MSNKSKRLKMVRKLLNPDKKLVILGLTLLAFILRIYRLDFQSYWIDEAWTVFFGNLSLAELWHLLQTAEIMPPLYHPSTIFWIKLVGDSEYALRFYSLVFGVMAIPFTYRLGKDLGDDRLGLAAALLMAVAPFQIWHSQEARMYSMLTASSAMSMWGFVNLWQRGGWRWWLVYIIGTEWAIMTHYHGLVLIGIQGLFLLLTWQRHWRRYLSWGGTLLVIFLLSMPWFIFGADLLQSYLNWIEQPTLADSYIRSAIAYSLNEFVPRSQAIPLILVFIATYGLGLLYSPSRRWGKWHGPETLALLLAYTIAPNIAAWIYGQIRTPVYLERYLILVQVGYLLTVAAGVLAIADRLPFLITWIMNRWKKREGFPSYLLLDPAFSRFKWMASTFAVATMLVLVGINAWVLYHHYFDPLYAKSDWRAVAKTIENFGLSGDAILLTGDGGEHAFNFYYQGNLPVYHSFNLPPPTSPDYQKGRPNIYQADQIIADITENHRRLWYTPYGVPIDATLERWLAENTYPAWHSWLGRKRLALYDTQPPAGREEVTNAIFTDSLDQELTLTHVMLPNDAAAAGDLLPLTLTWQTDSALSKDYQLSLRLINNHSDSFVQSDWPPLSSNGGTSTWPANQPITDRRSLWLPPDIPPGDYLLQLVVYNPESGEPLGQSFTIDNIAISPAEINVPPHALPIPNFTETRNSTLKTEKLALVGYALPQELQAGQEMWLWLYWQAQTPSTPDTILRISLASKSEIVTENYQFSASIGPLDSWQPGQVRRAVYHLHTGPRLTGEEAEVKVALISGQAVEVDTTIGQVKLNTRPHQFEVPAITHPTEIAFGNSTLLKLIGYDLSTASLNPGGVLAVTLYWQAEAEMDINYTVFIQMLSSQGQVMAQVDLQPQAGVAPTTTWFPGEILTDPYTLSLPTDLPSGNYHLITGLYNATTGQRLAIDSGGNFVELGEVTIN